MYCTYQHIQCTCIITRTLWLCSNEDCSLNVSILCFLEKLDSQVHIVLQLSSLHKHIYIYLLTMRSVVGSNPTQGRFFSFEKEKAVLSVYPLCHVCIQQVL